MSCSEVDRSSKFQISSMKNVRHFPQLFKNKEKVNQLTNLALSFANS